MAILSMDPPTAHAAMGREDDAVLVDVRTAEEFEQGRAKGAVNIPWAVLDARSGQMARNPDFVATVQKQYGKQQRLYLSCAAGMRSMNACHDLETAGYTNLVNVDGGFGGRRDPTGRIVVPGWRDAGLPVEG